MFKNYFKSAWRQLTKNKLFSAVNIIGLSTGLASIMALSLLIYQYVTTNDNLKGMNQMYYLKTGVPGGNPFTQTVYPLLGEIVKTCPEVIAASHIQSWYYPWLKYDNKEFQETTEFVDTGYFKVFQFPFKYGNPATALNDKFSIVLSDEMSQKFFGDTNPVGKIITADDSMQLTVTGVLKHVPNNCTVKPEILLPTAILESNPGFKQGNNWYNTFASNYLRLRKNSDPKKLDAQIASIVKLNYAPEEKNCSVFAVPFSKILQEQSGLIGVIIKGAIGAGIFILLIILVNLINLNAAAMYARSKEVAVRQMIGGSRKNIITQFCFENGLVVFISVLFAWLLFSLLLLPAINSMLKDKWGEIETGISKDYPLIILFAGIGIIFTIIAASMPALKIATVKVTDAVKGKITSNNYKGSRLRNIFITVQFVLAITLICVAIIFNRQMSYMKSSSLGFNKDNVAVVNLGLAFRDQKSADARFESILNTLKNDPHVKSVSTNNVVPTAYDQNYNNYVDPSTSKEVMLRQEPADAGYVPTYQIHIIQGKNFNDNLAASEKNAVMINRSAMVAFGWKDAVGKKIKAKGEETTTYNVVGVMENFHYQDLQNNIEPLIQWYGGKPNLENRYLSVRTDAGYMKPVMNQLEQAFKTMPSRRDFSYELIADKVDQQYALLDGILKVTNYIALLTILIAAMGMFGLISLFAKQRVKEIGIRKVLGASVGGIVRLLSKDFLLLVGAAIIVATPIAWYIMNNWLQDFAYRINISWWMFLLSGCIAIFIALVTVSFQAIKASMANPVKSLRTD
ncbi:MAG: ABC transporter permease [Ginsengibacter sp.]